MAAKSVTSTASSTFSVSTISQTGPEGLIIPPSFANTWLITPLMLAFTDASAYLFFDTANFAAAAFSFSCMPSNCCDVMASPSASLFARSRSLFAFSQLASVTFSSARISESSTFIITSPFFTFSPVLLNILTTCPCVIGINITSFAADSNPAASKYVSNRSIPTFLTRTGTSLSFFPAKASFSSISCLLSHNLYPANPRIMRTTKILAIFFIINFLSFEKTLQSPIDFHKIQFCDFIRIQTC